MGKSYRRKSVRKGGKKSKTRKGTKKNKTRKNYVAGAKIPKKEQQLLALKDFMKEIDSKYNEYKRKHGDVDIDEFEQDMKTLEVKITTARNNNVINAKQFNMLQQEIEMSIALAYDHEQYGSDDEF